MGLFSPLCQWLTPPCIVLWQAFGTANMESSSLFAVYSYFSPRKSESISIIHRPWSIYIHCVQPFEPKWRDWRLYRNFYFPLKPPPLRSRFIALNAKQVIQSTMSNEHQAGFHPFSWTCRWSGHYVRSLSVHMWDRIHDRWDHLSPRCINIGQIPDIGCDNRRHVDTSRCSIIHLPCIRSFQPTRWPLLRNICYWASNKYCEVCQCGLIHCLHHTKAGCVWCGLIAWIVDTPSIAKQWDL